METTIGQRIRQLREAKQLSVADFAAAAGVKPSAIYGLESNANKPSIETVGALREAFPDLDTEWLQFGGGQMFKGGQALTPAAQLPPQVPSKLEPSKPELPVPGEATPIQADFVGRLISQLEQENARKDALIEWLQEQNAQLLKKPLANLDAAAFMVAEPATPISLRPKACQPTECVVRPMWGPSEVAEQVAA